MNKRYGQCYYYSACNSSYSWNFRISDISFCLYDYFCKKSVNETLRNYNIKKTQFQIIKEYHENKGEKISEKEISQLEKRYRQREPEQFLIMYDAIRDKARTSEN